MRGHELGATACVVLLLVLSVTVPHTAGSEPVRESAPVSDNATRQVGDNATEVQNFTIEQLSLLNVTLTNASIGTLRVINGTHGNESVRNRTMENVSVRSLTVNGTVLLNVSLADVTIRNDSVAETLLGDAATNESIENGSIDRITLEGVAVVEDETIDGVAIDTAVVRSARLPNFTGRIQPARTLPDRSPALTVESARVGNFRASEIGNGTATD